MIFKTVYPLMHHGASQVGLVTKNPPSDAGDVRGTGLIPGSGSSYGEGTGNPLQHSCLENPWTEEAGGLQPLWSQRVG